jgi:hypothetical protein
MGAEMTKTEKSILALGCIVCRIHLGVFSTAEPHHVRRLATSKKRKKAPILPLCHAHHNAGVYGESVHSGRETWEKIYGNEIELLEKVNAILEGER